MREPTFRAMHECWRKEDGREDRCDVDSGRLFRDDRQSGEQADTEESRRRPTKGVAQEECQSEDRGSQSVAELAEHIRQASQSRTLDL